MDITDVKHLKALKHDQKRAFKDLFQRLLARDMVFDNIKDLIPAGCTLSKHENYTGRLFIKFDKEEAGETITVDIFEAAVKRLSKKFRKEPSMYINEANLEACWSLRVNNQTIYIELTCGNTEKCDFITVKREVEEVEAVGYCALLKQKKFLES